MKVLILGAFGFVGKHLIDYINENYDWKIIATKRKDQQVKIENIDVVELDITSFTQVKKIIADYQPNYIINLAAQSSVRFSWENPQRTVEVNLIGTLNILESVRLYSPRTKILLIGSSEEYGQSIKEFEIINENDSLIPNNPYAISKFTQFKFMEMYHKAYNINVLTTRSFNHCGPGQSELFVVSDFCKQVIEIEKKIKPPVIYVGNIDVKRDFTDVRDVVSAYCKLLEFGISGETYNVGSGKALSISNILQRIIQISDLKIEIEHDIKKYRPIDNLEIKADISKIKVATEWFPKIHIDQTISDTLEYWRNILNH